MTTPPVPPEPGHAAPPGEPVNPWAPPSPFTAHPPTAHPAPAHAAPPVPPQRTSRVGLVIVTCLGVLLVGLLATVFFLLPNTGPAVGDCVKLTGVETNMKYEKVSCDGKLHNYVVSKVMGVLDVKCGEDPDAYTTYNGHNGEELCLIPVFFDGECYDFVLASLTAENKAVDCGARGAIKVRVLANTADAAACGADSLKAMAYQETKTTYCFTPGS